MQWTVCLCVCACAKNFLCVSSIQPKERERKVKEEEDHHRSLFCPIYFDLFFFLMERKDSHKICLLCAKSFFGYENSALLLLLVSGAPFQKKGLERILLLLLKIACAQIGLVM